METESDYLKCRTCRVQFSDQQVHREHFKSDWHLYNIKRKVIKLAPISVEDFVQRQELSQGGSCVSSELGETDWYCAYCSRRFQSKRAWVNHQDSKKHKEKEQDYVLKGMDKIRVLSEKANEKGLPGPTRDEMNEILRPPLRQKKSATPWAHGDAPRYRWLQEMGLADNCVNEMEIGTKEEDEFEVLNDGEEVDMENEENDEQRDLPSNECLFCGELAVDSDHNLRHMAARHDFRLPDVEYVKDRDHLLEYLSNKVGKGNMCLVCNLQGKAFFTLKAVRMHMLEKGHCWMSVEADNALEYVNFYDFSNADDQPELLQNALEKDENGLGDPGFELVLPSGAILGHRELNQYYRQKPVEIEAKPRDNAPAKFKAIGYGEGEDSMVKTVAKDLRHVWKALRTKDMKRSVRNNQVSRHHFKDPTGLLQ